MSSVDLENALRVETCDIRLDKYLSEALGISRSRAVDLIENKKVLLNGLIADKKTKLTIGDVVEYCLPEDEDIDAQPEEIPLDIFYEDSDVIVINKPQGMVVHPAPGNPNGTLVNALLYHCKDSLSGINGKLRPGIVHRIDKDTSGLIIVAKNDLSHAGLADMFKDHSFTRIYHAIVHGNLKEDQGTVAHAIGRSKKDRKKMAAYPSGTPGTKDAVTHYRVLERFNGYCHVELKLETGRTHQIRVHMQSLGHPLLGDPLYAAGRENHSLIGQCLHAKVLGFVHPVTNKELYLESDLPEYFTKTVEKLRKL